MHFTRVAATMCSWNKRGWIPTGIFVFVLCLSVSLSPKAFASDNDIKRAIELFNEAMDILNFGSETKLLKAEQTLLKAISLVPYDDDDLCYDKIEPVDQHKTGRWVKQELVRSRVCKAYFPNREIEKIRAFIPPKPWVVAHLMYKAGHYEVHVSIFNRGRTRMEDISVRLEPSMLEAPPKNVSVIMPGDEKTFVWKITEDLTRHRVRITVDERYGFVPCMMDM